MHQVLVILALLFVYSNDVTATLNVTDANITDTNAQSGWFTPSLRGTADILWDCLSTLFICVWCSLHLNVPAARERKFRRLFRKLKWMVYGILAPELLVYYSIEQWSRAQGYWIKMGDRGRWTTTHSFYANMGGFVVYTNRYGEGDLTPHTLDAKTLAKLVANGTLDLPDLSEEEIRDKSKADHLGKVIACVQVTWLLIQCGARAAQRLPITLLELSILGYVLCSFVTYYFWWDKPLDVMVQTVLKTNAGYDYNPELPVEKISNNTDSDLELEYAMTVPYLCLAFVVLVFGGIHCSAWGFSFPSAVEQLAWRICAVLTIVLGINLTVFAYLPFVGHDTWFTTIVFDASLCLYIAVRIYLIVEMFVSLRSAPAEVYRAVDWLAFVPHL